MIKLNLENILKIIKLGVEQKTLNNYIHEDSLMHLFKEQSLLPLLYKVTNEPSYKKYYLSALAHDSILDQELANITNLLSEAKIKHVLLKGILLKKMYPNPCFRTMGDIDILIEPDRMDEAVALVKSIGFTYQGENEYHFEYGKGIVNIELHSKLLDSDLKWVNFFETPFSNLQIINGYTYRLEKNYEFIFLLVHLAKHFTQAGAGLRPFIDFYLLLKNHDYDEVYITTNLKELGLFDFYQVILSCVNYIFDYEKYEYVKLIDEDIKKVLIFALKAGIHGFGLNNNRMAVQESQQKEKQTFFKKAFPSFHEMKKQYPYLKKCCLLLPYAYLYRIIHGRKKIKRITKELKNKNDEMLFYEEVSLITKL